MKQLPGWTARISVRGRDRGPIGVAMANGVDTTSAMVKTGQGPASGCLTSGREAELESTDVALERRRAMFKRVRGMRAEGESQFGGGAASRRKARHVSMASVQSNMRPACSRPRGPAQRPISASHPVQFILVRERLLEAIATAVAFLPTTPAVVVPPSPSPMTLRACSTMTHPRSFLFRCWKERGQEPPRC